MTSAPDDLDDLGTEYVRRLTTADLRALLRADGLDAAEEHRRFAAIERQPALVLDILNRPATSAALLNLATAPESDAGRFTFVSPFLVFAAAVHRTAADLAATTYVADRAGPRLRVPVFDAGSLTAYLTPGRRLFLADLLTSFARVRSGVTVVRTARGLRRRRWSDLDPARLAVLLDAVPETERAGVWKRLGDLALFLTGVFPDHAARVGPSPLDAERLARLTHLRDRPDLGAAPDVLFEWFGARWYDRAGTAALIPAGAGPLKDAAEHFHEARRVLNAATDRYLFPATAEWFASPGSGNGGTGGGAARS